MASRSTLEILISNREGRECSKEELSLALEAMGSISHFYQWSLQSLIEAIEKSSNVPGLIKLRCQMEKGTRERLFQAAKKPPAEWLGPNNLPGSPEMLRRMTLGKKIFKAATGESLNG